MDTLSVSGRTDEAAFEQWRIAICRQFVALRPEPSSADGQFHGFMSNRSIAGLTVSTVGAKGQRVHRGPSEISRSDVDALFLTIQLDGETGIAQSDDRRVVRGGDLYLLDARSPFTLHCQGGRGLTLAIPRAVCHDRLVSFERLHGLVATPVNPIDCLLRDYLLSLAGAGESFAPAEAADIADQLVTLVSHALSRHQQGALPPHRALRAAQFARAMSLIDRNLRNPEFGPALLARSTGVSLRHLQALCAQRGTSPVAAIRQRRLALAKRLMLDSACARKTITQIAFESGFRDLSHFGRVFAHDTGQNPRAWRRSGGQ
jgi:AraC family transcriptional activator of tynA and feaB